MNFTAELMTKIGNIKEGKTPTYDDIVDASFAKKAIEQLGEWNGQSARRRYSDRWFFNRYGGRLTRCPPQ